MRIPANQRLARVRRKGWRTSRSSQPFKLATEFIQISSGIESCFPFCPNAKALASVDHRPIRKNVMGDGDCRSEMLYVVRITAFHFRRFGH
jgi:hypothetical protein